MTRSGFRPVRSIGIAPRNHRYDAHRIVEELDGKSAYWMEKVSDEQYQK